MACKKPPLVSVNGETGVIDRPEEKAMGGVIEGAARNTREMFTWNPAVMSPDQQINPGKDLADARGVDSVQNDGYAIGAINTNRDSIVGSQYVLNIQPDYELLGADEGWAEEFQRVVESRFNLIAESEECWFDAARRNTFTGLLRLIVGGYVMTGEVFGSAEWLRGADRPFSTAIKLINPSRLCNPDNKPDERYLRRGVQLGFFGDPIGYHIRSAHPSEFYDFELPTWRYVPARKPWGRRQIMHIVEQLQPDQTRGVADMVSVLKQMRMTRKFQDVVLQNAVVNATYAAAIESELPSEAVFASMGAGQAGFQEMLGQYMTALEAYVGKSTNIAIDGVKMPHLFPGTKLSLKPIGTPGGVGSSFEESLLRHTSAGLGMSYEQFSKDYTKTNYSSSRASKGETEKYMSGKKKVVADRAANFLLSLWFEEEWNAGNIPIPPGKKKDIFYDPVMREALLSCTWIGASRGQIDELKETQSAAMRINGNLSTLEAECARLGQDYRRVLKQRAREVKMLKLLGLDSVLDARKPGVNDAQNTMRETKKSGDDSDSEE